MRLDLAWMLAPPSGGGTVTGTLATTEAADIAAFNGSVVVSGSFVTTEAIDTASFAGTVIVSGSLITTEAADTAAFNGTVLVTGTFATTEGADTASFSGSVTTSISGSFAITEAPDTADFEQFILIVGGKSHWQKGMEEKYKSTPKPADLDSLLKKAASHMSSLGGHARAKSLTATQRSSIATKAANTRWN